MSNKFKMLAVISLCLVCANVVHALSCQNGDSSCSTQSAADCSKLGYSTADVDNCKHYLYCPFNLSYKTCVAFNNSKPEPDCSDYPLTSCPANGVSDKCPDDENYKKLTGCKLGYTLNTAKTACIATPCPTVEFEVDTSSSTSVTVKVKSTTSNDINKCGSKAEKGWEIYNTNTYSGNSLCYACKPRSCPDDYTTEITSQDDCTGLHEQFVAADTSFGDDVCGKCQTVSIITTCEQHGYHDNILDVGYLCKTVQTDLGYSSLSTCYDCVACEDANIPNGGIETSRWDCNLLCGTYTEYSSEAMIYYGGTTMNLSDTDGRKGACYSWQGAECTYGAEGGDCYCQYGQAINSCNGY